ncbi:MAG: diiron oxygenase [Candidatus Nomurabacteria bacterium]|nr:MAG: diiron oxygenase [Candidatus Nomurabacteria bacterium]
MEKPPRNNDNNTPNTRGGGGNGRDDYEKRIHRLSKASAKKYNNPFENVVVDWIDWESPDNAMDPTDERWILGPEDNLGAHPWYQSLPKERQIEVGLYRFAHTVKVGSQFEELLVSGIMNFNLGLRNGKEEFRYAMHEATEETHHIQMFQEFVNLSEVDTKGAPAWFRNISPYLMPTAGKLPVVFWATILAGEEPIDHMQKAILRQHENLHPLLKKIMQVHVAEEARHISFAHSYLEQHIPKLTPAQRKALSVVFPMILRIGANVMMRPSEEALNEMGIPKDVADEVWWDSESSKKYLQELFPDARKLADNLGLRGRLGRAAWKLMGIDSPDGK